MKQCLKLEDLTVEQKIGMVLTVRNLDFSKDDAEFVFDLIGKRAIGAVQINPTGGNFEKNMRRVLETADYPILIGCDMERGFPLGKSKIPGNMALGALHSAKAVYDFAYITAKQAKKVGYNMIWSPVVDCADHDRPCTICRCFGDSEEEIAEYGTAYLKAFADCGLIGSAKHYPSAKGGHMDTHMAEEVSDISREDLIASNLLPYRKMLAALGDDMMGVMVGHQTCAQIDPDYPATLSKPMLDLIRDLGFNGLLITDSFAMVGLIQNFGNDKILGLAIRAGNDLILPNYRISFKDSYNYLLQNFKDGMFSEERLNEAVARVLKAQKRTLKQPANCDLTAAEEDFLAGLSKDCVCEFRDAGVSPALDKEKKHLFVLVKENQYPDENGFDDSKEICFTTWWNPFAVKEKLQKDYPNSEFTMVCEFPSRRQVEHVCVTSTTCEDVVYLTFCDSQCYQGTDGLTERLRILMEATAKKNAAVLHFGNPYAAAKLVHGPRLILGYQHPLCVESGLEILAGDREATAAMPIHRLKLQ